MKLVGPWISGFTRRTAITMKLLGIPFEHLNLNAYTDKEEVRRYSPMGKVPALVLDHGEVLIDSPGIIDVLHEMAGPEKALIPPSGAPRLKAPIYSQTVTGASILRLRTSSYFVGCCEAR